MRTARIVEEGAAYYHILSRVVDRRMVFDDGEKALFCKTLRRVEGFSGVKSVIRMKGADWGICSVSGS